MFYIYHETCCFSVERINNKEIDPLTLDKGARRCTVIYPVEVIKNFGPENINVFF